MFQTFFFVALRSTIIDDRQYRNPTHSYSSRNIKIFYLLRGFIFFLRLYIWFWSLLYFVFASTLARFSSLNAKIWLSRFPHIIMCPILFTTILINYRFRRSPGLKHGSSASRFLGLRVRMPPGAWMFAFCDYSVSSGGCLCDYSVPSGRGFVTRVCHQVEVLWL